MRPLETLSLFLLFVSLLFLFFDRRRTYFLTLLFLTIVISILQYFIEGLRWQLYIFIYFLPAIYICHIKQEKHIHFIVKTFFFILVSFSPYCPMHNSSFFIAISSRERFCWYRNISLG